MSKNSSNRPRPTEEQETVDALSQEEACFSDDSDYSDVTRELWSNEVKVLLEQLNRITSLAPAEGRIQYLGEQEVISALSQEEARFTNIKFDDEVFGHFIEKLANNRVTKRLAFHIGTLSEKQTIKLARFLEADENLTSLELCDMSDDGAEAMVKMLRTNKHLIELIFNAPSQMGKFIEAFKVNLSLQKIDLSYRGIAIGDSEAIVFAEVLKENTSLQVLNLQLCNIGNEGAKALVEALKVNTSLQELDLSCNKIEYKGAIAIAGALRVNTSLKKLDLKYNEKITKEALPHFCFALHQNKTLEEFKIFNPNITITGNVVKMLKDPECKYNTLLPHGSGTKKACPTPIAKDYSASTEEKQKDGDNQHEPEGNPSDEQSAGDSAFDFSAFEEALPQTDDHKVTAAGESSGIE